MARIGQGLAIDRFGDVFTWYYGDQISKEPFENDINPKANAEIAAEVVAFEKRVLQDLR